MRFPLFLWLLYSASVLFATDHVLLVCGQCLEDQRDLLLHLNQSLSFYDDRPADSKLASWNKSTDCCGWKGVTCDGVSGRVIGLDLSGEHIGGGIDNSSSSSLYNLRYLQNLNLAHNDFHYFNPMPIPSELVKLVDLTHLNLSNTGFEGQVPIEISHLTRLVSLNLSTIGGLKLEKPDLKTLVQNLSELRILSLDGVNIPTNGKQWGRALSSSLPNLQVLSLSRCQLSGPLDSLLSALPNQLNSLDLSSNSLTGPIPPLPETLTLLNLAHNSLTGSLSDSLPRRTQLVSLDLSFNNLTGPIPPLPETLAQLNLASNNLTGPLPDYLWNRLQLISLDLSSNNLTGSLPDSLCKMLQLISLDLSSNNLTGPIPSLPETLTQLNLAHNSLTGPLLLDSIWKRHVNLVYLQLTNNSLNGTIPSSLFTLPKLIMLELGQNQFSGQLMEFPATTSSLLFHLDLSSNKLEGPIPSSIFQLQSLSTLSLSSNNFSGTIQLEMIQKLQNLMSLDLSYNSLLINTTSPKYSNSSFPQFLTLRLASCKLQSFPDFLRQNQTLLSILDLSNNQIHGQIPTWVSGLEFLSYLNLSCNLLHSLDQFFPDKLPGLLVLDLHSNLLQGPIPILSSSLLYLDLSNNRFQSVIPSNLIPGFFLSLSSNNLTGEIPQSICNNPGILQVIDLSNNSLSGKIPSCLVNISDTLMVLKLRHNYFDGQIPEKFPVGCSLRTLDLSWNRLEGPLPRSLANCTELEVLNLGNNQLHGSFPSWLGSFTDLRVLVLNSNRFSGAIIGCESTNHAFSKLQIVDLSSNNFTGNLPSECLMKWTAMMAKDGTFRIGFLYVQVILHYADPQFYPLQIYHQDTVMITIKGQEMELTKILTIYTSVDLSNNGFRGSIPDVIGTLISLHYLNLSRNALTGGIPTSLGNLKQLESLDLSCNKLQGEIPQQLVSLTFLSFLNLSWNDLMGRIPTGSQFQTFTEASFGGNEGLCGAPLSRYCTDIEPAALPPATWSKKHQFFGYDWEMVVSGFVTGFGGGAGMVVAFFLFTGRGRRWLLARS